MSLTWKRIVPASLDEFPGLGDLRPGSITAVARRCGKPSCQCAKPNDPGHDPQFRPTRRVAGKTVTETFPNPIKGLHEGVLGEVYLARGLCFKRRDTIGHALKRPYPRVFTTASRPDPLH